MIHCQLMSSAPFGEDLIQFTVKTGTLSSSKRKITLSNFTEPVNCVIDWGDGSTDTLTSASDMTHTYASNNTNYQISITGQCGGFWNADADVTGQDKVVSVDTIRSGSLRSLAYTFKRLNITRIPDIAAPNLLDMSNTAYKNNTLTQVGDITASRLTNMSSAFYGCSKLTSFGNLTAPALTDMSSAFCGCSKLTELPEFGPMTQLTTATNAFRNCTANTTQFPKLWEQNPEADGTDCFTKCFAVSLYTIHGTECPRVGKYHPSKAGVTYIEHYEMPAHCPNFHRDATYGNHKYSSGCDAKKAACPQSISGCGVWYTQPVQAWYECASPVGKSSKCAKNCRIAADFPEVQEEAVAAGWATYQ